MLFENFGNSKIKSSHHFLLCGIYEVACLCFENSDEGDVTGGGELSEIRWRAKCNAWVYPNFVREQRCLRSRCSRLGESHRSHNQADQNDLWLRRNGGSLNWAEGVVKKIEILISRTAYGSAAESG